MSGLRRPAGVTLGLVGCVLLGACAAQQPSASTTTAAPVTSASTSPSTTTTTMATTTSASPRASRTRTTTTTAPARPTHTSTPSSHRATTPTRPPSVAQRHTAAPVKPAGCLVPAGVTARQVVVVRGAGSSATVRACRRTAGGYALELGPYNGHVGRNGVSWSKREGDLTTPAGTYPLRGGFGVQANPGLASGWFRVGSADVWVDDPQSALYNTHQRTPAGGRWTSAEPLLNTPAYSYAQVVGYNEARVPGKGSAIFFHVDTGRGTAGCVSLPTAALLAVFRWEQAGAVMSIG